MNSSNNNSTYKFTITLAQKDDTPSYDTSNQKSIENQEMDFTIHQVQKSVLISLTLLALPGEIFNVSVIAPFIYLY